MKFLSFNPPAGGDKGQTLIEVIVGLTAAVVVIAAIVSASLNALNNSEFGRDQNFAAQFTQEGMEVVRNMRNISIASLSASYLPDGQYCLAKACSSLNKNITSCWTANPLCPQNVDKFVRSVLVSHNVTDCNATPTPVGNPSGQLATNVKVTVTTSWFDTKCTSASNPFCHNVTMSSCFSDFTIVPTP